MSQRNILENSINLLNTLRGPAKILYAPATLAMPLLISQVIDPTGGAAATGWTSLGITRGGINVTKHFDTSVHSDVDQLIGAYGQDVTGRSYTISTQLGEILDRAQFALAFETDTPTQVSTTGPTQMMTGLDSGSNVPAIRRMAVVYPKATEGKVYAFVFRNVQIAGGDKVITFDKANAASPALDFLAFPEIATSIPSADAWGRAYDIL